jgi:CDP-6-deoxy-D-xylo-4-hexulose-3-dehydrase
MKEIKYKIHGNLKNTDFVMENTFWIGVYPGLSKYHLGYAIEKLKIFFK